MSHVSVEAYIFGLSIAFPGALIVSWIGTRTGAHMECWPYTRSLFLLHHNMGSWWLFKYNLQSICFAQIWHLWFRSLCLSSPLGTSNTCLNAMCHELLPTIFDRKLSKIHLGWVRIHAMDLQLFEKASKIFLQTFTPGSCHEELMWLPQEIIIIFFTGKHNTAKAVLKNIAKI